MVREDFTKREEALNAIAQLKKSEKVKLIGTVMNYCETETSEYYYSYYTKDGKKVKTVPLLRVLLKGDLHQPGKRLVD